MPSFEQLKLMFGAFPAPLFLATLLFIGAWTFAKGRANLDVWALAVGYAVAHQSISGFTGFPPSDALDWLPIGLLAIAVVGSLPIPKPASLGAIAIISLGVLAATLHGFKSYHDSHPFAQRLYVFAAIAIALITGVFALCAIAESLTLADFFLITGIAGGIGAGVLIGGFHTAKLSQALGIGLAIGAPGFIVGLLTKTRHVSPAYACAWVLLWVTLGSNAYLGNYELPPVAPLALLLAVPAVAGLGLLPFGSEPRPIARRIGVYGLALLTALIALALSIPPAEEETDDDNPYADWG